MVVLLAVYRPFLRRWTDPHRPERATLVSIVPRGGEAAATLRGVVGIFVPGVVLLPFASFVPEHPLVRLVHGLAFVLVMLALLVGVLAIAVGGFVPLLPYPGKIRRSGPGVPGTQLTINLAASTSSGGMRAVRAYLLEHHGGQRLTVRARDERALALYRALGLEVVDPGAGRMTGIIPADAR
ncbi:hypothetical protein AB6N23_01890 [Cellulomonas sp. 179-A 9B4 NHS]|uniref:hypothetical protein n=1 Tax=Cellulomonas sp. 179-A 9B4 NHS TaxID=3142379 RepID=UPI0039A35315